MRTLVLKRVLARPSIRRVELAFAGFNLAEYGVWVAVLVYAYERSGTTVTAVVAAAQLLPAALVAPLAATVADRRGGARMLLYGYLLQAVSLATTAALLFAAAPDLLVYGAAIVAASAVTLTRPAQAALVPELASDPHELTALNVVSGWVESVSLLAGPALAGLMIALDGPRAAVACFAVGVTGSALLIAPIRKLERTAPKSEAPEAQRAGGIAIVRGDRGLAALVALLGAQYVVIGALDVLLVVLAVAVLGLGPSGAGYLNAAFGAGGVIGPILTFSLIGRRHLAVPMISAAIGWALVLALLGAWPTAIGAFVLLAVGGSARSVLDVSGRTILLRAAPDVSRGTVFGMLEGVSMLGLAMGSILVPALVALDGAGTALIATGVLLSGIALAQAARLHGVDRTSAPLTA